MHLRIFLFFVSLWTIDSLGAVSPEYQTATQARISGGYIMIVHANRSKSMVPIANLKADDHAWLVELSRRKPMAPSNSSVVVVAAETPAKKAKATIEKSIVEGPLETVQLVAPNIMRDQIGGTCMLYARIHWLDICGYYTQTPEIYKIINDTPPNAPWKEPRYVRGLTTIFTAHQPAPVRHRLPRHAEQFEWAREQLRLGRPLLAAFPREIWQALPPGFIAEHPWNGGSVGHQIVINGFTWNKETRRGTFHIINSWRMLFDFDLTTEAAGGGALVIEESMSPRGEIVKPAQNNVTKETVISIRLVRSAGGSNLYEVETNLGKRRLVAVDENAVRQLVETP